MSTPKKRDPVATRKRILAAAQRVFHEEGYDGATTRKIAMAADVNMALINRYFGSKKGLFQEAVIPFLHIGWLVENGLDHVPETLFQTYVNTPRWSTFDPMVVFLRSATSEEAGPLLEQAMHDQILKPLVEAFDGPDARARAILMAAQLGGLIVYFRILGQKVDDGDELEAIRTHLMPYFQSLLIP